jgi:hypothetical protein
VLIRAFGFVIDGLEREPIYLRNHIRKRNRTYPQLIPKNEREKLMVREFSA